MNMKPISAAILGLTGAVLVSGAAVAGISGSKHDMGGGTAQVTVAGNNGEVCVYCHTPHAATTTAMPLWNKSDPGTAYNLYVDTGAGTLDNSTTSSNLTSASLACLSCHDGTQAIDAINNAPGSGLGSQTGTVTLSGAANIGNSGGDLTDDHPIGMFYADGSVGTGVADANSGFSTLTEVTNANLRFYGADANMVECATCHDVHNDGSGNSISSSYTTAGSVQFLRVGNSGSALCLTCHIK